MLRPNFYQSLEMGSLLMSIFLPDFPSWIKYKYFSTPNTMVIQPVLKILQYHGIPADGSIGKSDTNLPHEKQKKTTLHS